MANGGKNLCDDYRVGAHSLRDVLPVVHAAVTRHFTARHPRFKCVLNAHAPEARTNSEASFPTRRHCFRYCSDNNEVSGRTEAEIRPL